jgi:hypothetical protein
MFRILFDVIPDDEPVSFETRRSFTVFNVTLSECVNDKLCTLCWVIIVDYSTVAGMHTITCLTAQNILNALSRT